METTLNIHADILEKISIAARSRGMSRSRLIISLMKKVMADMPGPECIGRLVQYQNREEAGNWRIFHLQVKFDEYEYLLDLRKLLKMSVSLLLAYAVKKYLHKNTTDNYHKFQNYIIVKETINNIICWKLIWGYPPNPETYIKF